MVSKKTNEPISTENTSDLSYLEGKVTITNIHPFQRQGFKCPHCGSKTEILYVEDKNVYLVCAGCDKDKGYAPFVEGKLIFKGEGIRKQ